MSETIQVLVPDIGDFKNIPVIEVLVHPGDAIKPEDPLVTLESDKATMEVPSPAGGTVKELKVKVGDKVSQGSLVLVLEANAESKVVRPAGAPAPSAAPAATAPALAQPAAVRPEPAPALVRPAARPAASAPTIPPPLNAPWKAESRWRPVARSIPRAPALIATSNAPLAA